MSQLNNLEDIGQDQRALRATPPLLLVNICAQYGKNSSWTVHAAERTWQDMTYYCTFIAKSQLNDFEDIGQNQNVIACNTPSYASDHLCQTGKESIQNCTCSKADTAKCDIFWHFNCFIAKLWLNDFEDIGQGQ